MSLTDAEKAAALSTTYFGPDLGWISAKNTNVDL